MVDAELMTSGVLVGVVEKDGVGVVVGGFVVAVVDGEEGPTVESWLILASRQLP